MTRTSVCNGHLRGPVTLTYACCRTFGSGAVPTCFSDLGLLQLGFEHSTFRMQGERPNRLHHRRGPIRSLTGVIFNVKGPQRWSSEMTYCLKVRNGIQTD